MTKEKAKNIVELIDSLIRCSILDEKSRDGYYFELKAIKEKLVEELLK